MLRVPLNTSNQPTWLEFVEFWLRVKVDPDDIRTPDVAELQQMTRLYTLHCGIQLNEESADTAAAGTSHEMTYNDKRNHHLWLKSKANR